MGTPIIEITFKKLKSYKIFDKIVLDTESDKIIKATKYLGFDFIIKRLNLYLMTQPQHMM